MGADPSSFTLRRILAALLVVGMLGVVAELLLVEHFEGLRQILPLGGLALGILAFGWHLTAPSTASRRTLQSAMMLLVVCGLAGIVLHYESNLEFQEELHPDLQGLDLALATLSAKSPPGLAPGILSHFGLCGLVLAWGWTARRSEKGTLP